MPFSILVPLHIVVDLDIQLEILLFDLRTIRAFLRLFETNYATVSNEATDDFLAVSVYLLWRCDVSRTASLEVLPN